MIYRFDDFELDTEKRELRFRGELRPIEPQVFDLLNFLIDRRDSIVSRDQIYEALWPRRIVSDSLLGSRVNAARRAINDDGVRQRFIRTLRRNGIRFVGAVTEEISKSELPVSSPAAASRIALTVSDSPSIVVVPFIRIGDANVCPSVAAELADEVGFALHRIDWLRVIVSSSVDGAARQTSKIRARYVLSGTVRGEGDKVGIIARLADSASGVSIWTARYEAESARGLSISAEIASKIALSVSDSLFGVESIRARHSVGKPKNTWEAIVAALAMINTRKKEQVRGAEALLTRLVDSDQASAEVFSLLSFCASLSVHLGWSAPHLAQNAAQSFAARALIADDQNPWAYVASGYCKLQVEKSPSEAIKIFEQALSLNPNMAMAHYLVALAAVFMGDTSKSFAQADLAKRCMPLDLLSRGNAGAHDNVRATASFVAGRYRDGIVFAQKAIAQSPLQTPAYRQLVLNGVFAGQIGVAKEALDRVVAVAPDVRRWLKETERMWSHKDHYRQYVEAFRRAGYRLDRAI